MYSVQAGMWDPRPPCKHASPLPSPPPSNSRPAHVTTATPAKRITFYKSGDSQFGGVRMAIHKRSFKCFDALLDDLSQKVPLPFGVRTVTTPRGTNTIRHLEQLQDGGCYLCSDRRHAKPINMELASKGPSIWYHHHRRPHRPETSSATPPSHVPYRQRRILLVKNSEPGMRRSVVLSRRSTRSLRAFLDEVSEVMQFHVRKLYTAEGRKIDSVQSLMTCPGVLVCVGREAFSPMLVNFIKKSSEEKLPGLDSRSPALGPRTPGNGARSPATQGARSPPHGAQSRASEYSDVHESKKNVNFGLETKKSIIHPRSDSNRSTHFSVSSEKSYGGHGVSSYSQARPAIMNDDIEKRVLVNKDGSLSVEMRVRFRLHNDETIQWSTEIKKSPSLTNDCCPLSQGQTQYLHKGQSESCSDPDSMSFDPEGVDYSSQALQRALEANHCPCCHQRQEQQYDLWENPAHSRKRPLIPPRPPHAASHTHTIMRHTNSSSSSSSCNSRRVVHCRAQLSGCGRGSGSEQSQLIQEEMCVTEQVERRVEVEQVGDTHVEVCRMSRCCSRSEVVAMDSNLRPLSSKSVEDELMEEEAESPLSTVSSSSHVLQSLKEDQDDEDDDLPPSVSQCSHSNDKPSSKISAVSVPSLGHKKNRDGEERSSRAVSVATSCHCGAVTPRSTAEAEETDRAPTAKSKMSRASCRSGKDQILKLEGEAAADNEDEEVNRVVSGLSGHTGLSAGSQKSGLSSVCPNCRGCKPDKEEERSPSATSAQSNLSAMSRTSGTREEAEGKNAIERAISSLSAKSGVSAKTSTSVKSHKSNCPLSPKVASPTDNTAVEDDGTNNITPSRLSGRPDSALSAKSNKSSVSAKTSTSHRSTCSHCTNAKSPGAKGLDEEGTEVEMRAASAMSAKSENSHRSTKASERSEAEGDGEERASSQISARSDISNTSDKSCKSNCNGNTGTASVLSFESASSAKSQHTKKSDCAAASANREEKQNEGQERIASAMPVKSKSSVRSSSKNLKSVSPSPNAVIINTPEGVDEEGNETTERAPSTASAKSGKTKSTSNHNGTANIDVIEATDTDEKEVKSPEHSLGQKLSTQRTRSSRIHSPRGPSALSVHSATSAKSGRSKCHSGAASAIENVKKEKEGEDKDLEKEEDSEELKGEEASEKAASILSSSSKRQRRESGGTEQPLSRCSSGSVSLGLPEDQETADSDSGKSSFSFHTNNERANYNGNKSRMSHGVPAVDIPTIETPGGGGGGDEEGEEQETERAASALTAKSGRSRKSSCNCSVKAAANRPDRKSKEQQHANASPAGNDLQSESVMSDSTTKASNPDAPSRPASEVNGKEDIADDRTTSVHSKSPCCLRPESAVSAQSGSKTKASKQSKGADSVVSDSLNPVKAHKAESKAGSERGNVEKKETLLKPSSPGPLQSSRPCSRVETCSESILSQSLSAADLLKEVMTTCPQSKASRASNKTGSEKSARCQRVRNPKDPKEKRELTPAFLPNASPIEVVNDWLRSIPANSSLLALGDELEEVELEKEVEEKAGEEAATETSAADDKVDEEQKPEAEEGEAQCDITEGERSSDPAPGDAMGISCPDTVLRDESLPRNWQSSTAVMKVLLSSSLGRCRSMPEVSPVYGRRLSTSAQGFLDCLAQLQLIEPAVSPGCDQQKTPNQQYEDIMTILQSLWLTEPSDIQAKKVKDIGTEQVTPPRSSSGVDMSSGSAGSGKENGIQGGDKTSPKETESLHEDDGMEKVVEEKQATTDVAEEQVQSEEQSTVPPSLDSPKATENPSSSDKSSGNNSSPTDNEQDTVEDTSSGTTSTVLRAPLSKKQSREPDPVWVLHLLKKVEKQFINHYINAMAEFKVRWDLDDSLILDTMITELRDEVSRRIESSVEREIKKIQSRAGRGGRSPRPPRGGNLSRESTMTEKRRQILKVMKNQSVKTADSLSDGEMTAEFSDQRSEDDYCPCDACVRKKMAARPLKENPNAAEAPVMMEFDLLKILQLKKGPPAPAAAPQTVDVESERASTEEGRNLEVVCEEEEEEEEDTKEDFKAKVVLEEMIPEEDEEIGQDEEEEKGTEREENSGEDEEQEEAQTGAEETGEEEEASVNGEEEEEEEECQCQSARNEEETSDNTGEDETADDEEKGKEEEEEEEEEGENVEDEENIEGDEAGDTEDVTGTEEEEGNDEETVKEAAAGDGETTENNEEEEETTTGRESGQEEETEDNALNEEDGADDTGEEESRDGTTGGESEEQEMASTQDQGVTEGEDADAEDSDTDKRSPGDTSAEEFGREGAITTGDGDEEEEAVEEIEPEEEEEEVNGNTKEDSVLLHQFTRTSVESQPGSLEDVHPDSPSLSVSTMEVPKMAEDVSTGGGTRQIRSRSPARIKRRKPKESDVEVDNF
ncbi:putative retinitis pigmentosa 1-like 1 protein [Scophthalmus maximus]|uniref:Putative retinitis pigmentosa 1-like 1 protein n=1 Tax=Scophthalmus maximus TaxID=52904 RepID=A0A2U9AVF8_SCOMX|nr:putative retinitis pigmentosa 1-like 1 protein [Scophthalmus maximus]